MQEPVITTTDAFAFSKEYFIAIKEALIKNENTNNIHFVIHANNNNLKLENVPVYRRHYSYEVVYSVDVKTLRKQHSDIDLLTASVMNTLYNQFKPRLVIH